MRSVTGTYILSMKEKGHSAHLPYEWEIGMIRLISQKYGEGDGLLVGSIKDLKS